MTERPETEAEIQKAVDWWDSLTEAEKLERAEKYKHEQAEKWAVLFDCPTLGSQPQ